MIPAEALDAMQDTSEFLKRVACQLNTKDRSEAFRHAGVLEGIARGSRMLQDALDPTEAKVPPPQERGDWLIPGDD